MNKKNNQNKVILTEESRQQLQQKLDELITRRKEIAGEIRDAKDLGDISENTEFAAAREAQAHIQLEIEEIEDLLKNYDLFKEDKKTKNTVTIGTTVKFEDTKTGETEEVKIVTIADTDPLARKISNESPLGKALIGSKKGDVVEFESLGGMMKLKVVDFKK